MNGVSCRIAVRSLVLVTLSLAAITCAPAAMAADTGGHLASIRIFPPLIETLLVLGVVFAFVRAGVMSEDTGNIIGACVCGVAGGLLVLAAAQSHLLGVLGGVVAFVFALTGHSHGNWRAYFNESPSAIVRATGMLIDAIVTVLKVIAAIIEVIMDLASIASIFSGGGGGFGGGGASGSW